jgi:hypothetical protein
MKKVCLILVFAIVCLAQETNDIKPFTIKIEDAELEDLNIRLGRAIIPSPRVEAGWEYGMNLT